MNRKAKIVLISILVVILIGVIAGAIYVGIKSDGFKDFSFITGKTDDTTDFECQQNGVKITKVNAYNKKNVRVDLKNAGSYSVKIQQKTGVDFEFTLDGKIFSFASTQGAYTSAFSPKLEDDYFELDTSKSYTEILSAAFFGHTVGDVPENLPYVLFEIVVTSESGDVIVLDLDYSIQDFTISIEPGEVIF